MIKTKISAVTGVTYGLLSALVIVVALGALTAAGVGVENVFSLTGNTIASTMGTSGSIGSPNPNLNSEQQSEIANAAAEIAAGTASAACLQQMNNSANAASMASNGATCLGPGMNIAPPQQPIKELFGAGNYPFFTYPDGQIYAIGEDSNQNATSLNARGLWFYNDGFMTNNFNWEACSSTSDYAGYYSPSTVTTTQGSLISCTGGTSVGESSGVVNNTNTSQSAPLGYAINYTW